MQKIWTTFFVFSSQYFAYTGVIQCFVYNFLYELLAVLCIQSTCSDFTVPVQNIKGTFECNQTAKKKKLQHHAEYLTM